MGSNLHRSVWRAGLFAVAAAIIASLSLTVYCAFDTATYVSASQQLTGTVVDIEKPVFERQRNDFRPVVEATLPSGDTFTLRFSGLYRVPADAVGHPITLLYNPAASPTVIPDSHLNWIGSYVYGGISIALMFAFALLWFSRRWVPPTQGTENKSREVSRPSGLPALGH